jgi:hypothetical protein
VKNKIKLFRYTPWRHLWGEEKQLLLFLTLSNRRGWLVSITLRPCFNRGERRPIIHCTGGWAGPTDGLDAEARGKIFSPVWNWIPTVKWMWKVPNEMIKTQILRGDKQDTKASTGNQQRSPGHLERTLQDRAGKWAISSMVHYNDEKISTLNHYSLCTKKLGPRSSLTQLGM